MILRKVLQNMYIHIGMVNCVKLPAIFDVIVFK